MTSVVVHAGIEMRRATSYVYFSIADNILYDGQPDSPIEIEIEYWDEGFDAFNLQYDSRRGDTADDHYVTPEFGRRRNTNQLQRWHVVLTDWRFANKENGASDFRIGLARPGYIDVRSVSVYRGGQPMVLPTPALALDGLVRVLGISSSAISPAPTRPLLADAVVSGATAAETYVRWVEVAPTPTTIDFSLFDQDLAAMEQLGLQWVPSLVAGPGYSVPPWFRGDAAQTLPARCLEHNLDTTDESIFNPELWPRIEGFLQAFAAHYAGAGQNVPTILLGISGTFGESIYTADGNPEQDPTRHAHLGYWAGDLQARAAFRSSMEAHYQTVNNLNAAWATAYTSFDGVSPFLQAVAPSRRSWLDFLTWYHDAMTEHVEQWLDAARRVFPTQELVLVTGGSGQPALGSDVDAQARVAAQTNTGMRITNEGSSAASNLVNTSWVDSATRFYGVACSHEPAGVVDSDHLAARAFSSRANGCFHHQEYLWNVLLGDGSESYDFLRHDTPVVDAALLISRTSWFLNFSDGVLGPFTGIGALSLRDRLAFDLVGEEMVADGALANYRFAVIMEGQAWPSETLRALDAFVVGGGTLFAASPVQLATVDGVNQVMQHLFGSPTANQVRTVGSGKTDWWAGSLTGSDLEAYLDHVASSLRGAGSVTAVLDGAVDGVFTARTTSGVLFYNENAADVTLDVGGQAVVVPAHRATFVRMPYAADAYAVVSRPWDGRAEPGGALQFSVRNDGSASWNAFNYSLGYHVLDPGGAQLLEGRLSVLATQTDPGSLATFSGTWPANLLQAVAPGSNSVLFDMVQETVGWFQDQKPSAMALHINVTDPSGGMPTPSLVNDGFDAGLGGWRLHGASWLAVEPIRTTGAAQGIAVIAPASPTEPGWVEQSFHLPLSGGTLRTRVAVVRDDCAADVVFVIFLRVGHTWTKLDERSVAFSDGWVEIGGPLAAFLASPYRNVPSAVRVAARSADQTGFCSNGAAVDRVFIQ